MLDGPEIHLKAGPAVTMAMALHELATNATKYGAWSDPAGRVDLTWRSEERDDRRTLRLTWAEKDGGPVKPPEKFGFGLEFIEKSLAYELKSAARFAFEPEGFRCEIVIPLDTVSPAEGEPAETGPAESGPGESGPGESGPGESGPANQPARG